MIPRDRGTDTAVLNSDPEDSLVFLTTES